MESSGSIGHCFFRLYETEYPTRESVHQRMTNGQLLRLKRLLLESSKSPCYAICSILGLNFRAAPYFITHAKSMYCLPTKKQQRNHIIPQKFLSLFSLTKRAACIMKYRAVRKCSPFLFRLLALRTSYVTSVSYLFRLMFLRRSDVT